MKIGKRFLIFSLVLFLLIGCSSSVLASSVSDSPNSDLGVTVNENKGDPVAVIGKDEFLISKGTVLTGDMLIEGLGLKVVDADGNDLHMPDKIRFGYTDSHSADEEAAVVNDYLNYSNGGAIYVYARVEGGHYKRFQATVTTIDNSNIIYPVEDPYRGVVAAIIGQYNIKIPYGSKITGDMILDNLKVVDADGNDLGLTDKIKFRKPVVFELKEITADEYAEDINKLFQGNPTLLSTEGFYYTCDLEGPATSFNFMFDVSRYPSKDDFIAGEPYAITGGSEELEIYVEEGKIPNITGNMLTRGLKVVDIYGTDLGMSDKIIFYKGKTPEAEAERLKEAFVSNGWLSHGIIAVIDGYSEAIRLNINVRSVTSKDDEGTIDKVGKYIAYTTHVQNYGWQKSVADSKMSGTSGESLRLEGIKIASGIEGLGVSYSTHVENIGWQDPVADGTMSGTSGKGLRLEAIRINLTGEQAENYDVYYRVHAQNVGWMGWAKNGADAGTAGYGYRLEGIEIQIVEKGAAAPGTTNNAFIQK